VINQAELRHRGAAAKAVIKREALRWPLRSRRVPFKVHGRTLGHRGVLFILEIRDPSGLTAAMIIGVADA
jgi:hypothetical protein